MMLSWSVSSQNVIDSTRIRLTKPVAKLVVKDLIIGDGLKLEVQTLNELLAETNSKLDVTKNLVTNLETQVNNYQKIIDNKDLQLGTSSELSEKLKKQLEKEQRAKKLYKLGSTVGAAAVLLLLIQ
tara:strand:+ start:868 stop:1245 length:378 start_codon:yes stop_codon:yes gene_type:complete